MSKAGIRNQAEGNRRAALSLARICGTKDCGRAAMVGYLQCRECHETSEQLAAWYARRGAREAWMRMAFFRACHAVRLRLWIPMLVSVLAALAYLAFLFCSDPDVQVWMAGGMR